MLCPGQSARLRFVVTADAGDETLEALLTRGEPVRVPQTISIARELLQHSRMRTNMAYNTATFVRDTFWREIQLQFIHSVSRRVSTKVNHWINRRLSA